MHVAAQETANQLLERYVLHLIKTEQHTLVPLYACLMRTDKRRTLYASYLHDLTMHSLEHCWRAYRSAQDYFDQWRIGDVETGIELDRIVEQVGLLGIASVKDCSTSGTAVGHPHIAEDVTALLHCSRQVACC